MHSKKEFRIKAKTIRENLDIKKISSKLISLLQQRKYYKEAQNVMLFFPLENEVDITDILTDDKNFYLPRVRGEDLEVCPYKKGDTLKTSALGLQEPINTATASSILDLVIVPALMVDRNNYRLGYGKGFYDKFLAQNPLVISVTLIPNELIVEKLPVEEHDMKLSDIIST